MPVDLPPDVDAMTQQESVIEVNLTPNDLGTYDSVDPEFVTWAEKSGIDLDRDDAFELVMAEYERTNLEKTFVVRGYEIPDFFANTFGSMWYTFNLQMYQDRKKLGLPPINPDPEDGFLSRAAVQQYTDEVSQWHRESLEETVPRIEKVQGEGELEVD